MMPAMSHLMHTEAPPPPLIEEIDWLPAEAAFARLSWMPGIVFLDSAASDPARGNASYIGIESCAEIRLGTPSMAAAMQALRTLLRAPGPHNAGPLPFMGGLVGMISYETGLSGHGLASRHTPDADIPAFIVRRYDLVIGFDHMARRAWIFAADNAHERAAERVTRLKRALDTAAPDAPACPPPLDWRELTPYAAYEEKIHAVQRLIYDGDIYQANISTRFVAERPSGFEEAATYLSLRALSAAPFAAYMDLGAGSTLLSASPERFVSLSPDGTIETRPIKGTSPRFADPVEDARSGAALAASEKDKAENLMICDLLRNDLSIVSRPGSVIVPQLATLEQFASVWHLVSVVKARLTPEKTPVDLLEATMPGGSITGAPKRRAMEIIDAVEDTPRGPNYGCLFWIADEGAMDSSIIIRSLIATPTRIIAQAGGAIVADSSAADEYAELRTKIAPLLAIGGE